MFSISAGKLAYDLDPARKTISVNMSDVVQDTNYYVRLCHQRFVCEDVGSVSMVSAYDILEMVYENNNDEARVIVGRKLDGFNI